MCVCCVQESLEKQTQHAKTLAEKLWLAERQLEELEVDKDTRDKRTSDLTSTIFRLETEVQRQRWFLLKTSNTYRLCNSVTRFLFGTNFRENTDKVLRL